MKIQFFSSLYKLGLKYPRMVLFLALFLAVLSFFAAKKLRMEMDFSALLPPRAESVQNLEKLKRTFGNLEFLYTTVESQDSGPAKEFASKFAQGIEALPEIQYVDYERPVEFFQKRKWLFLDLSDLEEMENRVDRSLVLQDKGVSPFFNDFMDFADPEDRPDLTFQDIQEKYSEKYKVEEAGRTQDDEGRFIIVRVKVVKGPENLEANRSLVAKIRKVEQEIRQKGDFGSVKVGYAGTYLTSIESVDMLNKEIFWVTSGVLITLILILIFYFRQISGAFLVGVPLIIGVLWTGGLIYFILGRVNIVTAFAVSILAGLGSDYGIYLLSRFGKERQGGSEFEKACDRAFRVTGKATFTAMITTVGAFGALIFSGFKVFVEFGVVGAVGLLLNFIAMMLVMPSLLAIGERFKRLPWFSFFFRFSPAKQKRKVFNSTLIDKLFFPRRPLVVIVLFLGLVGLSVLTLPNLRKIHFEDGQMNFDNIPSNRLYKRISKTYGSSLHPTVLLTEGVENERKILRALENRLKSGEKSNLVYEKVLGLSTFIPDHQEMKKEKLKSLAIKYPENRYINPGQKRKFINSIQDTLKASNINPDNVPLEVKRLFLSPVDGHTYALYVFPAMEHLGAEDMARYNQGILQEKTLTNVDFTPVDGSFVSLEIVNLVTGEALGEFFSILGFFSLVLLITLRDIKRTLMILANIFGGFILISGAFYLLNIKLNILNIAVFPIILGTGIDCFIHLNHRFNETGDLRDAIQNEVPAILVSNLTSIVGFGGLLFTSGAGIRSIGWVSDVGLFIITMVCVFIFPRCLALMTVVKAKSLELKERVAEY